MHGGNGFVIASIIYICNKTKIFTIDNLKNIQVVGKNAELEKQITPMRKIKLFKTDLLQLTADELNYSLCLFVKEVRKPNGAEYAPDTIYYLCLGKSIFARYESQ